MTSRARKQPERRTQGQAGRGGRAAPQRRPGIVLSGLSALGSLAARHPSALGGTCAFVVVFSFVAANALWYQPGGHPSPILKTRTALNTLGFSATRREPDDVTTFVIERVGEDEPMPAVTDVTPGDRPFDVAKAETGNAEEIDPIAAAIMDAEKDPSVTSAVQKPVASDLVMKIQKGLSNIAYTDIAVDGLIGEKTRMAIRHFEKHYRLPQTGEPNEKVLAKLKEIGAL
jgi:peptidoglycan hydrolase-like protein with peptidoglycan-binding domain